MPEMAKYVHVNSFGTAQMLEIIRDENLPVRKVVVASSQAVYREGAAICREARPRLPGHPPDRCNSPPATTPSDVRSVVNLRRRRPRRRRPRWAGRRSTPSPSPTRSGWSLMWGRQTGVPTVALRYSCTYGPRQSIFNPYTGVIAIFATRLLNGQPPVLYEDGEQTRDFCYVGDIARANLLAAQSDALDGLPVNVGSGRATTIREVAHMVSEALEVPIEPVARGEFRPGEMRHLTSDISRAASAGYAPEVELPEGIERYIDWIRDQGDVRDYFAEAEKVLRAKSIVHEVRPPGRSSRSRMSAMCPDGSHFVTHLSFRCVSTLLALATFLFAPLGCGAEQDAAQKKPPPAPEPAEAPPLEEKPAGRVVEVGSAPEGIVADPRDRAGRGGPPQPQRARAGRRRERRDGAKGEVTRVGQAPGSRSPRRPCARAGRRLRFPGAGQPAGREDHERDACRGLSPRRRRGTGRPDLRGQREGEHRVHRRRWARNRGDPDPLQARRRRGDG